MADLFWYMAETNKKQSSPKLKNKQTKNLKMKNTMIPICFQGKPFKITVINVYATITDAEEAEVEQFYEDLQQCLELMWKTDVLSS